MSHAMPVAERGEAPAPGREMLRQLAVGSLATSQPPRVAEATVSVIGDLETSGLA